MIGTALAIGSAASSLFGAFKSAQANKAAERQLRARRSELQAWYDKEYNTNYLDTAAARGTLQILKNNQKDLLKRTAQSNAIRGASDEKQVATAEALQKDFSNKVTGLATQGTARQDNLTARYQAQKNNLEGLQADILAQKSQNWSNFMNNAMNAGIGFAEASGKGAFDQWDGKIKSMWQNSKQKKSKTPPSVLV